MSEEAKNKEGEEQTPNGQASPEEKKPEESKEDETSQKNTDNSEQPPTPEEIALWKKKATDFDGIMEKRRLEKLSKKDKQEHKPDGNQEHGLTAEDVQRIASEIAEQKIQKVNQAVYEDNLTVAYRQFSKEHSWADNEDMFSKISENFNPGSSYSVENLIERLKIAAQNTFPTEYNKAIEERIKSDVLRQKTDINTGDISGGGSSRESNVSDKDKPKETKFFKKSEPVQNWYKKPESK